jgi:hypothetical protein
MNCWNDRVISGLAGADKNGMQPLSDNLSLTA